MNNKTIKQQKALIAAFERRTNKLTLEQYRKLVSNIMGGYVCYTRVVNAERCYRARINPTCVPFQKVSELWYPPKETINKIGRFNQENEQLMYVAVSHETATLEMRPAIGQILTVMQLKLRANARLPQLMEIGMIETNEQHQLAMNYEGISLQRNANLFRSKSDFEISRLARKCIAKAAMEKVDANNNNHYLKTIAIAKILLSSDEIDGIIYPSIAGDGLRTKGGENMVLKPNYCDANLEPEYFWMSVIDSQLEDGSYRLKCINNSTAILNGDIHWKNNDFL